ncbi:MAG: phosphate transporter permease subunit PstC [Campylobacterota bacterium]|nr:phosphate transporter permease subunit PstC [Campylobacterota bacterium]
MNKIIDSFFANITKSSALLSLIILAAIMSILFFEALPAMEEFGFSFISNDKWAPNKEIFGGFPSIAGSFISTFIAMLLAVPIAIGIAIFLSEIATKKTKSAIGVSIELLAAIPSVIYGMWGLFYFAPIIRDVFGGNGIGMLTAGIVLAVMILPFIAAISRDAMNTTPDILKESAYALGATKWDVIKDIIIPFAKTGVIGSIILAIGRAMGETMAVTFVMGNVHKISTDLTLASTNIPTTLANEFAEAEGGLHYSSLFYLAFVLFTMSFATIFASKMLLLRNSK